MLVHQGDLHIFVRHEKVDMDKLLKFAYDRRLNNVSLITDHNLASKEYKAVFTNCEAEWITILNYNNNKVLAYLEKVKLSNSGTS